MQAKELIEYLSGLNPEGGVSVLPVDLERRIVYKISSLRLVTDAGIPVLVFELGEPEPLDEEDK